MTHRIVVELEAAARPRLRRAADILAERLRVVLSVPYPPASAPGEPPHERSGELRDSVRVRDEEDRLVVDVLAEYAAYLEFGTSKMAARPFAERTIREALPEMREALK